MDRRLANGVRHTGWSRAWFINFWVQPLDADKAYEDVRAMLTPRWFDPSAVRFA
ncbi:hypothetical protein [Paenibacillus sp. FSL W7-1332]|uniref:glycosyl hydrolase family 95 catalytic domain-containing protein n=1 Tax=Paenibacillus sp. FSL W7-1332 TaxID=2921702 RepID=UPI0030D29006